MMGTIKIDCIVGIDPGATGAIAIWRPGHKTEAKKMPREIMDLKEYLEYLKGICNPLVFIEKVQLRPDDITDNPGKAFRIQEMLNGFQKLKDVVTFVGIPFVLVHPQKWQNELKLRVKGEEKPERKKRYQRAAAVYYPELKATLWNSDALMILHFGRYMLGKSPEWVLENLPRPMHAKLF